MNATENLLLEQYQVNEIGVINAQPQVIEARFSPCGRWLAAAGYDARVRIWSLSGKEPEEVNSITGHNGWVHAIAFHPTDIVLYSADSWGQLRATRWIDEIPTAKWQRTDAHDGWIRQIDLSADGQLLASCAPDRRACLWSAGNGSLETELMGHDEDIQSVRFHPGGGLLATGDAKGKVLLWDVGSRQVVRQFDASSLWLLHRLQDVGGVRLIRFNHTGTLMACGGVIPSGGGTVQGEPTLLVFDVATGKRTVSIKFGEQKDCFLHDIHWTKDDVLMGVTSGTPGAGRIVFHRLGDEKPFFESTKFPNCHSLSYFPASRHMAVVTTNRDSNGNGRRLNKDGEYAGNKSPIHLFRIGTV